MKIQVNKKDKIVPVDCSIMELISFLQAETNFGLAVAIGSKVIPREQWNKTILKEDDNVTIIEATCGG
ncbi:MAG: sulfur carrier protein ThiS [Bacteroidales bacterium]|jgi:sulfur carrier protein|nr:sulfur carrier protein ThiS [Bacteroidales bacterium]